MLVPHKRILIVDSSREIADKCRNLLERERFEVEIALNARLALQILDERAMNLVILDLELEGEDSEEEFSEDPGVDAVKKIRRKLPDIPIIVVHDRDPAEVEDALYLVKNVRFLQKPVEFEDIFDKIGELIPEA